MSYYYNCTEFLACIENVFSTMLRTANIIFVYSCKKKIL